MAEITQVRPKEVVNHRISEKGGMCSIKHTFKGKTLYNFFWEAWTQGILHHMKRLIHNVHLCT